MKIKTCIILFVVSALFSGCAVGPTWKSDVVLPQPLESIRGKHIIVSNFLWSNNEVSVFQEPVHMQDVSGRIAQMLREKGVDATAMEAVNSGSLHVGEILVSGVIIPGMDYNALLATDFDMLTVGILGIWLLPSPIPYYTDGVTVYQVEIIDADSKILLQTGYKRVVTEYKDYYLWGSQTYRDKYVMDTANAVADKIVTQLAEQVRGK
jgi:hypothetical protein